MFTDSRIGRTALGRRLAALLLSAHLVLGLFLVGDYGLSFDEPCQRWGCGVVNRRFLIRGCRNGLLRSSEKYHGPAFELVLIFAERSLALTDLRQVYRLRHLLTFLVFHGAVVVFYRVLRRRHASRALGLAGAAFLVLSPRLFAESFYNCKDMVFLSAYVFSLATLLRWRRGSTWTNAGLHGVASAFVIAVRVPGVVVPALTVLLALAERWTAWRRRRPAEVRLRTLSVYFAVLAGCTMLFWPVLLDGPVGHFVRAFREMERFPWDGLVLYRGDWIPAREVPWHYAPTWIALTTPPLYLALFLLGVVRLLMGSVIRSWRSAEDEEWEGPLRLSCNHQDTLFSLALLVPLGAVVVLHSTLYDGWRHLYFVYPPMLYVAVHGLVGLSAFVRKLGRSPLPRCLVPALVALSLTVTAAHMVRTHPYQNVYFNRLAGRDLSEVRGRYPLDYWGLSCREGLERLLACDASEQVRVRTETDNFRQSADMLRPEQRRRLHFVRDNEPADYYVTHYLFHSDDPAEGRETTAIVVDGTKILSVRRLDGEQSAAPDPPLPQRRRPTCEAPLPGREGGNSVAPAAPVGPAPPSPPARPLGSEEAGQAPASR
jgi:hypothetical protein